MLPKLNLSVTLYISNTSCFKVSSYYSPVTTKYLSLNISTNLQSLVFNYLNNSEKHFRFCTLSSGNEKTTWWENNTKILKFCYCPFNKYSIKFWWSIHFKIKFILHWFLGEPMCTAATQCCLWRVFTIFSEKKF